MYKMIAIDMDGTLLNKDHKISDENFNALKKAMEKGTQVVITTGRPLLGVEKFLDQLGLVGENDYTILFNGAIILNTNTKEVIEENIMSHEDLKDIYEISKEMGVHLHAVSHEACITPVWNEHAKFEAELNNMRLDIMDFKDIDPDTKIIKLMLSEEQSVLDSAFEKLSDSTKKTLRNRYSITKSAPFYIDILNLKVNKGFGVESMSKRLGIKREEIICIGDAGNDVEMIEYAGLGVAMGNAFEHLKTIADYVTLTNENHGVAHVVDKFILNV